MNKKLFAIIGSPVAHSLSPVLHNYWFKKYNDEVGPYQMNAVCQVLTGFVMLSMSFSFMFNKE